MSRSRRYNPIRGLTTAESEKQEKRAYNRRFRRATRQYIRARSELDILPHLYEYSNVWEMGKDGKMRFDPRLYPELMRK